MNRNLLSLALALMLGAIGMHLKVKDPLKRSIPAISVLTGAVLAAALNGDDSEA